MSITLRILLIVSSILAFVLTIKKINQSKLKISESIIWFISCILLIIMSIFSDFVRLISESLGFIAPVNFVFFSVMIFMLIQIFLYNIRISQLNEKVKELDHYIALNQYRQNNKQKNVEND